MSWRTRYRLVDRRKRLSHSSDTRSAGPRGSGADGGVRPTFGCGYAAWWGRRTHRVPRLTTVLLACCALAAAAETAAERGKRVVDEALRALGGDAFLHMQDRVESGRGYGFYREQLSGLAVVKIYTRYLAPVPGQVALRERDAQGKNEASVVLFTENGAWEVTFRGARPVTDLRYANYKDSTLRNIFYILRQRLDEPGLSFYSQGMDMYENRPVEIVDITDAANATVTVYFDQLTKLPTRQSFKRRNPEYKDLDT